MRDISNVKQEIINFRKIVRPQRVAFRDLERNKARYIAEDLDIYFDDIIDASERVWDLLENYKEVVEGLEATNESAIAHRTNETFRVLTAISLIFLPLTLIASIFGMNVKVPGEDSIARVLDHHARHVSACCRRRRLLPPRADGSERSPRPRRAGARRALRAHARDHQPGRDEDVRPAEEPRRLRAAGPLRRHDGRHHAKGHAIELCREAAAEGYDVVVAFGGDGTVNEAANGLAGSRPR